MTDFVSYEPLHTKKTHKTFCLAITIYTFFLFPTYHFQDLTVHLPPNVFYPLTDGFNIVADGVCPHNGDILYSGAYEV